MWGGLEGTQKGKLGFTRDALAEAGRRIAPQAPFGLITFGARTGGSCQSADALVAPAVGNIDAVTEALSRFNPQGRGPVVLGLEWARDQIAKAPAGSQIVLVHDGDDNCGGDMCRFANAFAQSVPGVKINAISLGLKANERAGAACLTRATGGRWFEAETAADVTTGLDVILASLKRPGRNPARAPQAATESIAPTAPQAPAAGGVASQPPQPVRPVDGANLELEAVLKASGTPVPSGIKWRIEAIGESGDDAFKRVFDRPAVALNLAAGRYEVTLEMELKRESRTIAVRAGQNQKVAFALDGGFLDLKKPTRGGQHKRLGAVATLEALGATDGGSRVVWSGGLEDASGFLVAPGRYRVTLGDGLGQAVQTIDLKDGDVRALALKAGSAGLKVQVNGLDDKQIAGATIEIAADDPTAPDGRRPVARSAATDAQFHLLPGTYHVTLDVFGDTNTDVVVLPGGKTVDQKISIVQMGLTVSSQLGATGKTVSENVRYKLWRAGEFNTPLKVTREAEPVFYLVPGKYRIESQLGQQNALIVRDFEIGRQRYGKLPLTHEAGLVSFELGDGSKIVDNNAFWALRDQNQRLIWRTITASPRMTLKAGLYTVHVTSDQKAYAAKFAVVAGHDQTVVLGEE